MPRDIASVGTADIDRLAVQHDLAFVGLGKAVEDVHHVDLPAPFSPNNA